MLKNKKIMAVLMLIGSGLQLFASGQKLGFNIKNNSTSNIDVYVANKNSGNNMDYNGIMDGYTGNKVTGDTYAGKKVTGVGENSITQVLSQIAPGAKAEIIYGQDPVGVVVRFYDTLDAATNKISKIISFPMTDKRGSIIVVGNNPNIEGNTQIEFNLTPWDATAGANNDNKPIANSVAFFAAGSQGAIMHYALANDLRIKVIDTPVNKTA